MEIVLNQEPVIPEHSPEIVSAIWGVSQHVGLTQEDGEDVAIRGNAVDLYLLVAVIAQRLAVGDLELVEKGDTLGKKDYQEKLIREIRRDWC